MIALEPSDQFTPYTGSESPHREQSPPPKQSRVDDNGSGDHKRMSAVIEAPSGSELGEEFMTHVRTGSGASNRSGR